MISLWLCYFPFYSRGIKIDLMDLTKVYDLKSRKLYKTIIEGRPV